MKGFIASSTVFGISALIIASGIMGSAYYLQQGAEDQKDRASDFIENTTGADHVVIGQEVTEESIVANSKLTSREAELPKGYVESINGLGDEELARRQMEGLITWNMLAASNCRVLTATHTLSSIVDEDSLEEDDDIGDLEPEDKPFWFGKMHRDFLMMYLPDKKESYYEIVFFVSQSDEFDQVDYDLDGEYSDDIWDQKVESKENEEGISVPTYPIEYSIPLDKQELKGIKEALGGESFEDQLTFKKIAGNLLKGDFGGVSDLFGAGEIENDPDLNEDSKAMIRTADWDYNNPGFDHTWVSPATNDRDTSFDWGGDYQPIAMRYNYHQGPGRNAYIGRFNGFVSLTSSDFDPSCIGSTNIIQQFVNNSGLNEAAQEQADKAEEEATGFLSNYMGPLAGAGATAAVVGGCTIVTGGICGGAVAAVGVGAGIAAYATTEATGLDENLADAMISIGVPEAYNLNLAKETGFDMEGRSARISFDINESFYLGESTDKKFTRKTEDRWENSYENDYEGEGDVMSVLNKPLLGLALNVNKSYYRDVPGFWRAGRFSYLLPAGLEPPGNKKLNMRIHPGEFTIKHSFKDELENIGGIKDPDEQARHWLYAFRPRMENVPIIAEAELSDERLKIGDNDDGKSGHRSIVRLRNFLANTEYLMCEGASGYVQSNAGTMDNRGESRSDRSHLEDQVYPKVSLISNSTACLETNVDAGILENENIDPEELECSRREHIISGESIELFERETLNGNTHRSGIVCGGGKNEVTIGNYGDVTTYYPERALSGCEVKEYDVTYHGDNEDLRETGLFDWFSNEDKGLVLDVEDEDEWIYDYDHYDREGLKSNNIYTEWVEIAFERGGVQPFEIELDSVESGSSEDLRVLIVNRGGNFRAVLLGESGKKAEKSIGPVSGIEGFNTVELNSRKGEIEFNRPQESAEGQSFSHESLKADRFEAISIKPIGMERIKQVNQDYNLDSDLDVGKEELSKQMKIVHIREKGLPSVCEE